MWTIAIGVFLGLLLWSIRHWIFVGGVVALDFALSIAAAAIPAMVAGYLTTGMRSDFPVSAHLTLALLAFGGWVWTLYVGYRDKMDLSMRLTQMSAWGTIFGLALGISGSHDMQMSGTRLSGDIAAEQSVDYYHPNLLNRSESTEAPAAASKHSSETISQPKTPSSGASSQTAQVIRVLLEGWSAKYNAATTVSGNEGIGIRFPHNADTAQLTICTERVATQDSLNVVVLIDHAEPLVGRAFPAGRAAHCWDMDLDATTLAAIMRGEKLLVVPKAGLLFASDLASASSAIRQAWTYRESKKK